MAQDLSAVIGQMQQLGPATRPMSYDIHTEQPTKGMAAFFVLEITLMIMLTLSARCP